MGSNRKSSYWGSVRSFRHSAGYEMERTNSYDMAFICLAVLLAPIVALSLAPLAACALGGVSCPFLAVASTANALFASGDLLAIGLLLAQVPTRATLRNKGWRVWWQV